MPAVAPLVRLAPFDVRVRYRSGGRRSELELRIDPEQAGRVRAENPDLVLDVESTPSGRRLIVLPRVTARRADVALDEIESFSARIEVPPARLAVFRNGWQSWSPTRSLAAAQREPSIRLGLLREMTASPLARGSVATIHSDLVTAIREGASGPGLVAGFLGGASQFGGFAYHARSDELLLRAVLPFEGVPLERGEERRGETLAIALASDVVAGLEDWASRLGAAMSARIGRGAVTGWCSWYEYFTRIDAAKLHADLARARGLADRLGIELFQIDDGYQAAIGDWTSPGAGFPDGVGALAREIRASGLEAGLWLAPFLARPESRVARDHPDWLARGQSGRPRTGVFNPAWSLRGTAWPLDPTHPGVEEWLARLVERVTREWGFGFLKLDFLYAAALPAVRHDRRRTGAEALRRGLEVVRRAAGEEVHLLGCGCPLGPAVGIVDSMRIGADVAPYWSDWLARLVGRDHDFPATKNAIRNTLSRSFLHGRLWQNDPDCLLARARRRLTLDEVQALASAIAVSGGTLLLSDALDSLGSDRRELVERVRSVRDEVVPASVRCLDLLRPGFPRTLWARRRGGGWYLAVLNPDDHPAHASLRASDLDAPEDIFADGRVEDLWTRESFSIAERALHLGTLRAHASRLLRRDP
jgi:alpha-galactosidase